jgi:hypothetical protein
LSQRYAAGCVEDEVGGETPGRAANVLEPHARGARVVGGGDYFCDARAGSDFDIRLLFDRWRQTRSSAGRDRANWSYPRSR